MTADRLQDASDVVGLIAGEGRLPVVIAEAVKARGLRLICVLINGEQPELARLADHTYHAGFGEMERIFDAFGAHGVRRVLMAGQAPRAQVIGGGDRSFRRWVKDSADPRDHSLFLHSVARFAELGYEICSPLEFVRDLLTPAGVLTTRQPTDAEWDDIRLGMQIAGTIAELDVGQTLVLKRGVILAVEAAEGTDETIRRAAGLASGAVVVKAARRHQDERFDLPTAGLQTVFMLRDARAAVLALEAGRTLLLDRAEVVTAADADGIAVVGATLTSA
ncbi:MAG: LpxI family protein [Armatimonadetes bacterium]|nr:LpxI family protein [Armatimonadota bacterium]